MNNLYKKFLASFSTLLAWPWQSMICQQSQQILADFILAFLAFISKKLYLPRNVGSTGGLLPSNIGRFGNPGRKSRQDPVGSCKILAGLHNRERLTGSYKGS